MDYGDLGVENKHVPNNSHTVMIISSSSAKFEHSQRVSGLVSKLAPKETYGMLTKSIAIIMVLHQSIKINI